MLSGRVRLACPWRRAPLFGLSAVCTALAACWTPVAVDTVRVVPATLHLPGVTRLLVGDFDGPGGKALARAVVATLLRQGSLAVTDLHDARVLWAAGFPEFDPPVPRDGAGSGAKDGDASSEVDAVLTATVVRHDVVDEEGDEVWVGPDGGQVPACVRRRVIHLQVAFRAADARTATLLDEHDVEVQQPLSVAVTTCKASTPSAPGLPPRREVVGAADDAAAPPAAIEAAYAEVARRLGALLQSYQEPVTAVLYHDRNDAGAVQALEAVRRGDWPFAAACYREVLAGLDARRGAGAEARAMAHYNLGVAYACGGALARGLYELAWSQAIVELPEVRAALVRARAWDAEARAARR